ncbi:MAG: hypothetical protein QOK63_02440 [Nitrososphaeraceae archaeon]|nr:hypothetical protein [Nitrososphaeraceae archaeon]
MSEFLSRIISIPLDLTTSSEMHAPSITHRFGMTTARLVNVPWSLYSTFAILDITIENKYI